MLGFDMQRTENIFVSITLQTFIDAAHRASCGHENKREIVEFMSRVEMNCEWLYNEFKHKRYTQLLRYRKLSVTNKNGKVREIDSPDFITRVFQYVFLETIEPLYYRVDPMLALNCKPDCGITATSKNRSVVKRIKHVYYDCRQYSYAVVVDQRKCYKHITIPVFRRMLRRLVKDSDFVDFAVNVTFVEKRLPIGTPTSPIAHHIVMLPFDLWIKHEYKHAVRYADDNFVPCADKHEANQLKWRIQNYWWYVLHVRAKRHTIRVVSLLQPLDFCGYIFHRNTNKTIVDHNKGYVSVRKTIFDSAMQSTSANYGSYFGILKHADTYKALNTLETRKMDLKKLTQKLKINRNMDAPTISVKDLADQGIEFTVYQYELRSDNKNKPNWIKCLIGYPETDYKGNPTGKQLAKEFHGSYQGIVDFHVMLEKNFNKKEVLPLTGCVIENSCGFIYKGSTNQIKYIDE